MPIYALGDVEPTIDPSAYISPDAVIIGDVRIGAESSVWPSAVLRGDDGYIEIGRRTSIQDGCVLHTTTVFPTIVGDDCVVGHIVHLEGCTIGNGALIGNGSILMHRVVVGDGGAVAANAVVLNDTEVPAGMTAMGVPAKVRDISPDATFLKMASQSYVDRGRRYRQELRRLD